MKKIFLFLLIILLASPAFSDKAKLGESEIKSAKKIKFINRSSRKAAEVVREQNTQLGKTLSEKMTGDATETSTDSITIRRFPSKDGKLGGDIFVLSESSGFGHVNSIVRILSSYIQNSFQYEEEDSDVLAMYVLYYNAMHRKDTAYISEKYTEEVLGSLDSEKIGIDENYRNWAGKTEIIIPIEKNILKEEGKDVKTGELGEEVNRIIETKKNGAETKKKFEELEKKKTVQEKEQIKKKEKEIATKEKVVQEKEKKIEKELTELKKDPEKNKQQIKQKETEKKQVAKEKEKVAEQKKDLAEKKSGTSTSSSASSSSPKAEKKPETKEELKKELVKTKEELAQKKAEEKKKELYDENVVGGKILFLKTLKYLDKGHYNNELQMIDPVKDDMIFRGEYNNICSNTFEVFGDKVVVIGYTSNHSAKHSLVLIDQETLKKTGESDAGVFWRTPMIVKGDELYAFEEDGESVYLSRFDKTLKRTAKSQADINPDSNVTFYGTKIYITGKDKGTGKMDIVILKKDDLSFIKRIQP